MLPASLEALGRLYEAQPPKGECVLVVGGRPPEGPATESLEETLLRLLQGGLRAKDAARQASDLLDVPRNVAYARALELKEQLKTNPGLIHWNRFFRLFAWENQSLSTRKAHGCRPWAGAVV